MSSEAAFGEGAGHPQGLGEIRKSSSFCVLRNPDLSVVSAEVRIPIQPGHRSDLKPATF